MASSSKRITSPEDLNLAATTVRHLGPVYRADICAAIAVASKRLARRLVRRVLAGDVALRIDLETTALVVGGRHINRDRDGARRGRVLARVDRDVDVLHVLLFDTENLRGATQPADDRSDVELAEVDQPLVVALAACGRIAVATASVVVAKDASVDGGVGRLRKR